MYNNYNLQNPYLPYGNYVIPQYPQRQIQMESQPVQQQTPAYITPNQNFIKGRPVVSIDEARAAQIDLDGSLNVFTDIGNKKIYTKQINMDGTATLNTYVLSDEAPSVPPEYVTKNEFNQVVAKFQAAIAAFQEQQSNPQNQSKQEIKMPNF